RNVASVHIITTQHRYPRRVDIPHDYRQLRVVDSRKRLEYRFTVLEYPAMRWRRPEKQSDALHTRATKQAAQDESLGGPSPSHSNACNSSKPTLSLIALTSGVKRYRIRCDSAIRCTAPVALSVTITSYSTLTVFALTSRTGSAMRVTASASSSKRFTVIDGRIASTAGPYQQSNRRMPPGFKCAFAVANAACRSSCDVW